MTEHWWCSEERMREVREGLRPYPYMYAQGMQWVPLEHVRKAWQAWKDAWGNGDSQEAYALMEMDILLGVDEKGNVVG